MIRTVAICLCLVVWMLVTMLMTVLVCPLVALEFTGGEGSSSWFALPTTLLGMLKNGKRQ